MRNGGSLPAHLSLTTPSDPSGWQQYKLMQPPLRADWVFTCICNAPDSWIGHALHKDQQAVGLLPLSPLGGAILTRGCACQEAAYQHWKRAVDKLWEDKCHRQQAAACQCLLDEHATHKQQEAACCQQLLNKRATQCLLDERAMCKCQAK